MVHETLRQHRVNNSKGLFFQQMSYFFIQARKRDVLGRGSWSQQQLQQLGCGRYLTCSPGWPKVKATLGCSAHSGLPEHKGKHHTWTELEGKVTDKAGRETAVRIPVLHPCWLHRLQELSEHEKQTVFLSCFLHSLSTVLVFPSNHLYLNFIKSCEQLKMPLADWQPLLLYLLMTRVSSQLIPTVS